ncbi:DNA topoisomerase 3-beta [Vitis vinifera]|uniref:DNA topoisomerase n=1 Tax=Vitis vinifera TaxID=29760 RepID=A0A438HC56_VITVI|nr:DNA topoisomerase 3-beta [Vitis vinifera]
MKKRPSQGTHRSRPWKGAAVGGRRRLKEDLWRLKCQKNEVGSPLCAPDDVVGVGKYRREKKKSSEKSPENIAGKMLMVMRVFDHDMADRKALGDGKGDRNETRSLDRFSELITPVDTLVDLNHQLGEASEDTIVDKGIMPKIGWQVHLPLTYATKHSLYYGGLVVDRRLTTRYCTFLGGNLRYLQINTFKPEKFWALHPYITHNGYELQLEWERNKLFDLDVAVMFQNLVMEDGIVEVTDISEKQESKSRPSGLNTVNLLKLIALSITWFHE